MANIPVNPSFTEVTIDNQPVLKTDVAIVQGTWQNYAIVVIVLIVIVILLLILWFFTKTDDNKKKIEDTVKYEILDRKIADLEIIKQKYQKLANEVKTVDEKPKIIKESKAKLETLNESEAKLEPIKEEEPEEKPNSEIVSNFENVSLNIDTEELE